MLVILNPQSWHEGSESRPHLAGTRVTRHQGRRTRLVQPEILSEPTADAIAGARVVGRCHLPQQAFC